MLVPAQAWHLLVSHVIQPSDQHASDTGGGQEPGEDGTVARVTRFIVVPLSAYVSPSHAGRYMCVVPHTGHGPAATGEGNACFGSIG